MAMKKTAGATLVEVLVALGVFAVGVGAFLPLVATSTRVERGAEARTQALALARQKVDEILSLPYPAAAALGSGTETLGSGFTRQWAPLSSPCPPGEEGDLARHLITVRWELSGAAGAVSLISARGRY